MTDTPLLFVSEVSVPVNVTNPAGNWPFVITKFTNEQVDNYYHDGFEISLSVDVRSVRKELMYAHLRKYEAYLVDAHRVILIVPSVPVTYVEDNVVYRHAEKKYGTECKALEQSRTEMRNTALLGGNATISMQSRVLLNFPKDVFLTTNIYGDNGCHLQVRSEKITCVNIFRIGSKLREIWSGRVNWRICIQSKNQRVAELDEDSNTGIDDDADDLVDMLGNWKTPSGR